MKDIRRTVKVVLYGDEYRCIKKGLKTIIEIVSEVGEDFDNYSWREMDLAIETLENFVYEVCENAEDECTIAHENGGDS